MNLGTYLVGGAVLLIVVSYVGRPFRRTKMDIDKVIEQWISDARRRLPVIASLDGDIGTGEIDKLITETTGSDDEAIHFCPQCGRRVEVDHKFCPGCGTQLGTGVVK